MEKYLNIVKFSRPNHNNPNSNVYDVREISGSIGDIVDNKWIVIEGGEKVVKTANLYWIDLFETTEILDSPYLECCGMHEECFYNVYRYEVDHEALDKSTTTSENVKSSMKDYIVGLDLAKPDTMDNSILQIETIVPKQGDINSYFSKPVLLEGKPIGVIIKATEINQGYKLSMMIWLRTVKSYSSFINNDLNSISIGLS